MIEIIKKNKKKIIIAGVILVIVITILAVRTNIKVKQQDMIQSMNQTETVSVEKRTLMSSISATGSIISAESKEISVSLSNVEVESVNVKVGDFINEGDILCTFDSTDIEESLAEAKASLNVTTTKTQMDIASSERGLAEAVESSSIEESRIIDDVTDALNDYEDALNDLEDAEDAYEDAEDNVNKYKDQLNTLNAQKTSLENEKNTYLNQFNTAKKTIVDLVNACNGIILRDDFVNLSITDTIPTDVDDIYEAETSTDIENGNDDNTENSESNNRDTISDDSSIDTSAIKTQLGNMKAAQDSYQGKNWSELTTTINTQIETVQKKYDSAKQTEISLENAYEQASSSVDSKYDAYEQKVRSQEDTIRNNESTIANKTDSVTTSKLNATTSGTSDKNQIEQYEEQLEDCTVVSPISGVVTALNIKTGNNYSGTTIATIEDISSYKITTEIDEYDIVDIEPGQKVVIKTNGTGDLELDGTVEIVAPRATSATGNSSDVTYTVTVTVDTTCDDLKLDMTAKLSIILESKENVLTVPYNAVQEDDDGNYYIELVNENIVSEVNKKNQDLATDIPATRNALPTTRIYISKGIESDYYIEIISDEVTEGMQVVVPRTEDTLSIQNMMMRQGPMGGF